LAALIAQIPPEHPLTAVIHAAGVLDDGLIGSLEPERLRTVMAPKVDGALNLHALTAGMELSQFVLFSSLAATLGSPGQANYTAANAFLDALAHHRQAQGLPATSLAWGTWEQASGMVRESDRARVRRMGVTPLTDQEGLALFDAARAAAQPALAPVRLDTPALRAQARAGVLPEIMQALVGAPARRASERSLASRLAEAPESARQRIVLELVQGHVAAVLGHGSPNAIDPERAFKDMGFDSLSAVELKNRLSQATGLKLPAALVFDHPTPAATAQQLLAMAVPSARSNGDGASPDTELRELLSAIPISRLRETGLLEPLVELARSDANGEAPDEDALDASIDEMGADELIRMTLAQGEEGA
ncbi:MAG: beta-ketoacyl reductase, partial [Actinomycetota bacterium]|nr:beta-ketoacyl reductase [Actinomycetota bacterium]